MKKIAFILAFLMLFLCSCGSVKEPAQTNGTSASEPSQTNGETEPDPAESGSQTPRKTSLANPSTTEQEQINAFYEKDFEKLAAKGGVTDEYRDRWIKKVRVLRDVTEIVYLDKKDITNVEYSVRWMPEVPLPEGRYVFVKSYPTVMFVPADEKGEGYYYPDGIEPDAFEFASLFMLGHRDFSAAIESGDPAPFYRLVCWARRDAEERREREDYHMTDDEFAAGLAELTRISIFDFSPIDARRDETGNLYFSPRYSEGCVEPNRIEKVEKAENGYSVTVRSYADYFGFVPSDLYVISVSRSDGAYAWVLDGIRIIEEGELPPAEYPTVKKPTDTETESGKIQGGSQLKTLEGTWESADAPPNTLVITNVTDKGFDFEIGVYRAFGTAGTAQKDGNRYTFKTNIFDIEGTVEFDGEKIVLHAEKFGTFADDRYVVSTLTSLEFPNKAE